MASSKSGPFGADWSLLDVVMCWGWYPARPDPARNRARVLQVAYDVFTEQGLSVPIDEIARRAGVGAGTVYRHFQTKEALFEAVIGERVRQIVRIRAEHRDRDVLVRLHSREVPLEEHSPLIGKRLSSRPSEPSAVCLIVSMYDARAANIVGDRRTSS